MAKVTQKLSKQRKEQMRKSKTGIKLTAKEKPKKSTPRQKSGMNLRIEKALKDAGAY